MESSDGEPTHLQGLSLEVVLSPRRLLHVPGLIPGNDFELWPAVDPLSSPPLACLARPGTHSFPNDAPPCLWLKHLVAQLCLEFGWNPARRRSSHLPSENVAFHARCCWGTGRTGCQPPRMTRMGLLVIDRLCMRQAAFSPFICLSLEITCWGGCGEERASLPS